VGFMEQKAFRLEARRVFVLGFLFAQLLCLYRPLLYNKRERYWKSPVRQEFLIPYFTSHPFDVLKRSQICHELPSNQLDSYISLFIYRPSRIRQDKCTHLYRPVRRCN